jgi:hypothetical protein
MVHLVELAWLFTAQGLVYFCSPFECNFNSVEGIPNPGEIANELKFYTATKLDFVCLITDFIELS